MRKALIAGNWKMNKTLAEARELVAGIREQIVKINNIGDVDVLICPPFQLLMPMAKAIDGSCIMLGAQNAHHEPFGAFTGEVSVSMLKDAGCTHVIIGHSERRRLFGEDNALLAKKVRAVLHGDLTAIYCVGETLEEREANQTDRVIRAQVAAVIARDISSDRLVIAYEPVWAIGTGRTATTEQAQAVHAAIRSQLAEIYDLAISKKIRVLYGGSMKPDNAGQLLQQPDVDGGLIGGACLSASDFSAIISLAASVSK
ncbi:MAG: triose-phosphate isomerase [Planctomycetes bacterium]|nr:triose-phosphate isomerase [Planctomycetota bacterium]MBI3834163.1 triose-phosphate isomerase [Planctomycetota bacterium]